MSEMQCWGERLLESERTLSYVDDFVKSAMIVELCAYLREQREECQATCMCTATETATCTAAHTGLCFHNTRTLPQLSISVLAAQKINSRNRVRVS